MGNSCFKASGSGATRHQPSWERPTVTPPKAQSSTSSSARTTPSHDFPQRATSSSGTSMAPRGGLPRLQSRNTQHQAVRSSQTYKALRPTSDYALFSRHGNVIGLIAKPGQPSPYFAPDFDAEPMVYCADGVIRRYPRPSEHELPNYEMQLQLGFISDAPAHLVTRHFGGFAATPTTPMQPSWCVGSPSGHTRSAVSRPTRWPTDVFWFHNRISRIVRMRAN